MTGCHVQTQARVLVETLLKCSSGSPRILVPRPWSPARPLLSSALLRQEAGLSGVVLNVRLQNPYYGPPGPSMVVPASWFAHRPLTAPPPPPPPPPPPQCALKTDVTWAPPRVVRNILGIYRGPALGCLKARSVSCMRQYASQNSSRIVASTSGLHMQGPWFTYLLH